MCFTESSKEATLVVQSADQTTKPQITQEPSDVEVIEGSDATFSIRAIGKDLKYQWKRNGTNIPNASDADYKLSAVKKEDNGVKFNCAVSNTFGSVESRAANLKVVDKVTPPKIVKQPDNKAVKKGETATFSIQAEGTSLTYKWQKNGTDIADANTESYTTQIVDKVDNNASFRCVVKNSAGQVESSNATLEVYYIEITQQPQQPADVICEQSFTLTVQAAGNPSSLQYEWKKDGSEVVGNSATLSKSQVLITDGGSYKCRVYNDKGVEALTNDVAVKVKDQAPQITTHPQSQKVDLESANGSKDVTFSVVATGTNLKYKWYGLNSNPITATTPPVSINQSSDGKQVYCEVSNSAGTIKSNTATITVQWAASVGNLNGQQSVELKGAQPQPKTIQISTSVSGKPTPTVTWKKNNMQIQGNASGAQVQITREDANSGSVNISCSASNGIGSGDTKTLSVRVTRINKPPVSNGWDNLPMEFKVSDPAQPRWNSVTDPDGDPIKWYITWEDNSGAFSVNPMEGTGSRANFSIDGLKEGFGQILVHFTDGDQATNVYFRRGFTILADNFKTNQIQLKDLDKVTK